jgi:parallel beta-helix repeat protein
MPQMKIKGRLPLVLLILVQCAFIFPMNSRAEVTCGQTIIENTILTEDLTCPPDAVYAIVIGASNITLDLGGHTISGYTPRTGVFATGQEGITIRNGSIDGFNVGVYFDGTKRITVENLTIRNMTSSDPSNFLFGIAILDSQEVVVRDSLFEFVRVAHREAVEIFDSYVDVSNIEVRGGGAGVNFSYRNGACDPTNKPSNGTVRDSRFSNVYIGGILVACSSYARIEGNYISGGFAGGVTGSGPFQGAVTGILVKGNVVRGGHYTGIDFGGATESTIMGNIVTENYFGITLGPSLGCVNPDTGEECFYPKANVITDNQTFDNVTDLSHGASSLGNTWVGNTCKTKDGVEIPECTPPTEVLVINYSSGKPGSYFTLEGANFPANSTVTIMVNGHTLGTVPTDANGDLIFLLATNQADDGRYLVTAAMNPSISVGFILDPSKSTRSQEGSGMIFNLPGGLVTHFVYMPVVRR